MISTLQPTIDERLAQAETKLQEQGHQITRHIRDGRCFGLAVYGVSFYDLERVRSIVGPSYKLLLNSNNQTILIR